MFKSREVKSDNSVTSYWISYTDLLASLLIIILLFTVSVVFQLTFTKNTVEQGIGELSKVESIREEMLGRIKDKLKPYGIEVQIADNNSVLRIPHSELTFKTNEYTISQDMVANLELIGNVILNELKGNNNLNYFNTVFIEGHTDVRPSNLSMGNMGLSTFRAISVWNHWVDHVSNDFEIMVNQDGERLFSVSGYGETRPIQEEQLTMEQLSRNRRIDIRFIIRNPGSFEYNELRDRFDYLKM